MHHNGTTDRSAQARWQQRLELSTLRAFVDLVKVVGPPVFAPSDAYRDDTKAEFSKDVLRARDEAVIAAMRAITRAANTFRTERETT